MDPSHIQAGKCYVVNTRETLGQVRRVIQIMPDGRVLYEMRANNARKTYWRPGGIIDGRSFANMAEREVPCGDT